LISQDRYTHFVKGTHPCSDLFNFCPDHDMYPSFSVGTLVWLCGMYHFGREAKYGSDRDGKAESDLVKGEEAERFGGEDCCIGEA
jgi:hypothetical protein